MLADLYVVYPSTREWVRGCYAGSIEHVNSLREQVNEAVGREQQLDGMRKDINTDLQNAVTERRRLQRELWMAER